MQPSLRLAAERLGGAVAGIGAVRRRAPDGLAEVQCSPDRALALRARLFRRRAGGVHRSPRTIEPHMARRLRSNVEAAGSAIISQPCWRLLKGAPSTA